MMLFFGHLKSLQKQITGYSLRLFGFALLVAGIGCNTTRVVKPLKKGETRISADAGGPVVDFPLPLSSISVAHGFTDQFSAFGGIHTSTLIYHSFQTDIGVNYGLIAPEKWQPGLSTNGVLNTVVDLRVGKWSVFPDPQLPPMG